MRRASRGFTLLEVVIALSILALVLFVLIQGEAIAVVQTVDAEKTLTATYLAELKMSEVLLMVEQQGVKDANMEEEGDFENFSVGGMDGPDLGNTYDDYHWAWAVRKVELSLGDVSSMTDSLGAAGLGGNATSTQGQEAMGGKDLGDMGIQPDMISEMLSPLLREVRVVVWWGEDEDVEGTGTCTNCTELVTHIVNPRIDVAPTDAEASQ